MTGHYLDLLLYWINFANIWLCFIFTSLELSDVANHFFLITNIINWPQLNETIWLLKSREIAKNMSIRNELCIIFSPAELNFLRRILDESILYACVSAYPEHWNQRCHVRPCWPCTLAFSSALSWSQSRAKLLYISKCGTFSDNLVDHWAKTRVLD